LKPARRQQQYATEAVVRAAFPTATRFFSSRLANAINTTLYDKLNYDFLRDIVPVASLIGFAMSWRSIQRFPRDGSPEFIAYAKANRARSARVVRCGLYNSYVRRTVQDDDRG